MRAIDRSVGVAFAEDLERHALLELAHAASVVDQRVDGPAQGIDEARRHSHAAGVDAALGRVVLQRTEGDDPAVAHGDVAAHGRTSATVIDHAVADQEIDLLGCVYTAGGGQCENDAEKGRSRERMTHAASPNGRDGRGTVMRA